MTPELSAALAILLLAPLNAVVSATINGMIIGFDWGFGNRTQEPERPEWTHRLKRAHANLIENLASFVGVVLIAHILGIHTTATLIAAWVFVGARLAFLALYTLGVTTFSLRTIAYFISLSAIGMISWEIVFKSTL